MAKLLRFTKTWVMDDSAERRSGSEVLEPMWRVTLWMLESALASGEVALRVRTRTTVAGSAARALESV
jgi:hypothetical protein